MPEVVVDEPIRRADLTEHRIDRRQAEPRHRVDERGLGVVEHRIGELHRIAGKFRQDGHGRHEREDRRSDQCPLRNSQVTFESADRRGPRQRKSRGGKADQAARDHSGLRKSDQGENRQQHGAVRCPADHTGCADGEHARKQMPADRVAQKMALVFQYLYH